MWYCRLHGDGVLRGVLGHTRGVLRNPASVLGELVGDLHKGDLSLINKVRESTRLVSDGTWEETRSPGLGMW